MSDCLFCKISEGAIPSDKVYESDKLFAINDISPQAPVHILIIPRIHQATLLDIEAKDHTLMGSVISVANQLAKERELDTLGYQAGGQLRSRRWAVSFSYSLPSFRWPHS